MLRFIHQLPRVIRLQWNCSWQTFQKCACQDEDNKFQCARQICAVLTPGEISENGNTSSHPIHGRKEKKAVKSTWLHQYNSNSHYVPYTCKDALGWGSVLILGLQLVHLWKSGFLEGRHKHRAKERACLVQSLYRLAHAMPQSTGLARHIFQPSQSRVPTPHPEWHDPHPSDDCCLDEKGPQLQADTIDWHQSSGDWHQSNGDWHQSSGQLLKHEQKELAPPTEDKVPSLQEAVESWRQLTDRYVALTLTQEASRYARDGLYQQAFNLWQRASLFGLDRAHYNLGICYENGHGVSRDIMKAVEHYETASQLGHSKSVYNLAMLHMLGQHPLTKDTDLALQLLEKAATMGLPQAQRELGVLFTEEERKDMDRACALFKDAANQGDLEALYYLAVCYEQGWGIERNECRAAELYARAARQGHSDAQYNLATFFERGLGGLPEDKNIALQLYEQALSNGNHAATEDAVRLRALLTSRKLEDTGLVIPPLVVQPAFTHNINQHLNQFLDVDSLNVSEKTEKSCSVKFYIGEEDNPIVFHNKDKEMKSDELLHQRDAGISSLSVFGSQGYIDLDVDACRRSASMSDLYTDQAALQSTPFLNHSLSARNLNLQPVSFVLCK